MKQTVKETIGHFKVLLDHATRQYEPSAEHVLKRLIRPLCRDLKQVQDAGTKNDGWQIIEGFSTACAKLGKSGAYRPPLRRLPRKVG